MRALSHRAHRENTVLCSSKGKLVEKREMNWILDVEKRTDAGDGRFQKGEEREKAVI
jgi:hypothetical protein